MNVRFDLRPLNQTVVFVCLVALLPDYPTMHFVSGAYFEDEELIRKAPDIIS